MIVAATMIPRLRSRATAAAAIAIIAARTRCSPRRTRAGGNDSKTELRIGPKRPEGSDASIVKTPTASTSPTA